MARRINQGIFRETPVQSKQLEEVLTQYKGLHDSAVTVLERVQTIYGYLPEPVLKRVALVLDESVEELFSIGTFYSQFTLYPKGKYDFSVCLGTACYINGSKELLDYLMDTLGVGIGQCTEDGLFSVSECRCVGCCSVAPVVTVNGKVYGKVKKDDLVRIIKEYREKEAVK